MREAAIIVGCSYGDEGKGLAAALAARRLGRPCLNVLINGGAQRGHTVDLRDGRRHVFHHFGSGSFAGAVSCADEDFIVNPLLYEQERQALERDFALQPRLLVSEKCRVSTPWDMMLGQIIEENRGRARHGSCGCGIYETQVRFRETDWALDYGRLRALKAGDFRDYCRRVALEYVPARLSALGMAAGPGWRELLEDGGIAEHAWQDWQAMRERAEPFRDWVGVARDYPALVFEAGQGLALDAENRRDFPHLTPSRTTSLISARRVAALPGETRTEVVYVTRTYLTRHGAGPFPTECPKAAINPRMEDRTNVPNPHQQSLRYGVFDAAAVLQRVEADLRQTRQTLPNAASAVLVTHLNETGGRLTGDMPLKDFTARFDRAWVSDRPWGASRQIQEAGKRAGG